MAYFALLWKARTIEKYRLNYENEKYTSITTANRPIPQKSLSQRWRCYRSDTQKRISRIFRRLYPEGSSLSNFLLYLRTDQTFPNFILKSMLGFLGGLLLTYLCFLFFVFQLSLSLFHASILSLLIGILLTLSLTFSYRMRCLVFLLIPQLFSRVGRYTLTCYALVLILTGPATNTLKNSEVLSESMACQQEQIKTIVSEIRYSINKPYNVLRDSIKIMIDRLKAVSSQLKTILLKINRLTLRVLEVIQSGFSWLNSLTEMCNKKFGTPFERCTRALNDGIESYEKRFGRDFSGNGNLADKLQAVCSYSKPYNVVCLYVDYINGSIIATIKKRLKNFSKRIRNMLYLQINIHHSYSFSSNTSHSAGQVASGIVTEIRNRADPLLTWLSWSSCVTSLFLLLIIFRAKYYQHMFETRSRFDNRYITKEIRDLDLKRLRQGRETVLPLNRRERIKYVTTTSFRLVTSEKVYLNRSAMFMVITSFKLLIHMVADYSLFWVLTTIRHHGKLQTPFQFEDPDSGVHITGSGRIAEIFRSLIKALKTPLEYSQSSSENCLPNPYPPDLQRYSQIGILIFLLWFFALFEPYGLRLRHVIMGQYRPERAKARAEWLYNHILRTRGCFMKFARRKLHRKYKYSTEEKYTFKKWLETHIPCWWLRSLLGMNPKEPRCLLCGTKEHQNDANTKLQRCNSPDCPGIYCVSCFVDIGQLCTICLPPNDYGDMSDVSLEKGSSDESDQEPDSETELLDRNTAHHRYNKSASYEKNDEETRLSVTQKGPWNPYVRNDIRVSPSDSPTLLNTIKNEDKDLLNCPIRKKVIAMRHTKYFKDSIKYLQTESPLVNGDDFYYSYGNTFNKNDDNHQRAIISNILIVKDEFSHLRKEENLKMSIRANSREYENKTKKYLKFPNKRMKALFGKRSYTNYVIQSAKDNYHKSSANLKHMQGSFPKSNWVYKRKSIRLSPSNFYNIDINNNSIKITRSVHKINVSDMTFKDNKSFTQRITVMKDLFILKRHRKMLEGTKYFSKAIRDSHNKYKIKKRYIPFYKICSKFSADENKSDHKMDILEVANEKNNKPNDNKNENQEVYRNEMKNTHTCYCLRKFRALCSGYWVNIKENLTSCSDLINISTIRDTSSFEDNKKHKCRKKSAAILKYKTEKYRTRKDTEDTRKYRISAYLAEQDWVKRIEKRKSDRNKTKQKDDIEDTTKKIEINDLVEDNNLYNMKTLNVYEYKQETENMSNTNCYESKDCVPICSKDLTKEEPSKPLSANILRRMSYYKSLGNNDFVVLNSEINNPYNNNKQSSDDTSKKTIPITRKNDNLKHTVNINNLSKDQLLSQEVADTSNKLNDSKNNIRSNKESNNRMKFLIKKICSTLFRNQDGDESACDLFKRIFKTVDGEGDSSESKNTKPNTHSCGCQSYFDTVPQDKPKQNSCEKKSVGTQSKIAPAKCLCDADVEAVPVTCECAIQYTKPEKVNNEKGKLKKQSENIMSSFESSSQMGLIRKIAADENIQSEIYELTSCSSCCCCNSLLSNTTHSDMSATDTTICSIVYVDKKHDAKRRNKVTVVTKANQSTTTEKAKLCDVSTFTHDWWSPIIERKNAGDFGLANQNTRKKMKKNRGAITDGKIVTFRSRAQVIPTGIDYILSPSRYLLESQKYYNELFSTKMNAPYVHPVSVAQFNPRTGTDDMRLTKEKYKNTQKRKTNEEY